MIITVHVSTQYQIIFTACMLCLCSLFENISNNEKFTPSEDYDNEKLLFPCNSHFIVASLSPLLFMLMILQTVLMMVYKDKKAPYIFVILSTFVSSPDM